MEKKEIEQLKINLLAGQRLALAEAITLVESESEEDQKSADVLLSQLSVGTLPTLRLAFSGSPGVGKSSLIEELGLEWVRRGYKVAVLAIDPSSEISKGSILGDKTRMELLSRQENAFIRPSSSRGFLGGVASATRETIRLCEAAGYQIILIETVGVGQSETMAAELCDLFAYVTIPGAGDDLQGIKKGILEKTDFVIVNKSEKENKIAAEMAQKYLQGSLKILRQKEVPIWLCSALRKQGINLVVDDLIKLWNSERQNVAQKRIQQNDFWFRFYLEYFALKKIQSFYKAAVLLKDENPRQTAKRLVEKLQLS